MQVNPMQLIQMIRNGQNPQQLMLNILSESMGNTPLGNNLIELSRSGNTKELERVARNICQQRGVDFDTEFANFKKQLGF